MSEKPLRVPGRSPLFGSIADCKKNLCGFYGLDGIDGLKILFSVMLIGMMRSEL